MPKQRSAMLASITRELIAPILRECPVKCGIVTITDVEISKDLSFATVYVSALRHAVAALSFLQAHRGELQKKLGALKTHKTPHLRFRIDERAERGSRLDQLLESTPEGSSGSSQ